MELTLTDDDLLQSENIVANVDFMQSSVEPCQYLSPGMIIGLLPPRP